MFSEKGVLAYCSRFFLTFQRILGECRELLFGRGVVLIETCSTLIAQITYILVMQCFRVVYREISHE